MADSRTELLPDKQQRSLVRAHLRIARADHWIKNLLVLPGIVVAINLDHSVLNRSLLWRTAVGLFAVCLVTSSNYVLNEILDAPYDRAHPITRLCPVPAAQVNLSLAYAQWIALMVAGVGLSLWVSMPLALTALALWIMGCVYN